MLLVERQKRFALFHRLFAIVEDYIERISSHRVSADLDPATIRSLLAPIDFQQPWDPLDALNFAADNLWRYQTHTPHPRYFGLFNPAPATMGVAADTLVAAFNPQLAAWSHSPFAAEVERHLVRAFGARFGYDPATIDGVFTSGGAEANHTALLAALTHAFPDYPAVEPARWEASRLSMPPWKAITLSSKPPAFRASVQTRFTRSPWTRPCAWIPAPWPWPSPTTVPRAASPS